ncbi:unnamed protein product [Rotaria magnacalcarata]|uniref:Uncharacterized protein n=1 Tax=Rotaria magnacalcarata TaxID=392030 RepID=A0A820P0Q2_9BILA|nr:unnamed protein product [Rotaria magnacalcarata]CAF4400821.1 unnamed protein product [Rotaria magnacalcarata]
MREKSSDPKLSDIFRLTDPGIGNHRIRYRRVLIGILYQGIRQIPTGSHRILSDSHRKVPEHSDFPIGSDRIRVSDRSTWVCFQNYETWISIYNPTYKPCYLYANAIVGVATSLDSSMNISTILNLHIKAKNDDDHTHSLTNNSEHNIHALSQHIEDQQQLNDIIIILKKHHPLFDTSTSHISCTGDNPPTISRPYPQTTEK